jgi:hypothetical protein
MFISLLVLKPKHIIANGTNGTNGATGLNGADGKDGLLQR